MPILVKGDNVRSETKANARHGRLQAARESVGYYTITTEILVRSLANFYCHKADKHMNL